MSEESTLAPAVSTKNKFTSFIRVAVLVATALAIVFGSVRTIGSTISSPRSEPELTFTRSESAETNAILADFTREGIRFTQPQESALRQLFKRREQRPDIQRVLDREDGTPHVPRLIVWALSNSDADAITFDAIRGDLSEAAARIGVPLPDGGEIVSVLQQTLAMRAEPVVQGDGAMWVIRNLWMQRMDIQRRFAVDGRVQVRELLNWVANAPRSDPSYLELEPISLIVGQVLDELPPVDQA